MLSCWYWWWGWCNWCRSWSGCRSFGCCQSIRRWVGVVSLLGSGPNSRCQFMGMQGKQLLFERQDALFQGELENAYCLVGLHASLLTLYCENEVHRLNFPAPPLDLIDNEEKYEIKQILKHRGPPKNRSYLIRWKGYTAEEDAWLKEAELRNATEFLYAYKKRIKVSPKWKT